MNNKPLVESAKDYSLAMTLFVFGLILISVTNYTNHTDGFFFGLAGSISILASLVSAILMRFFRH